MATPAKHIAVSAVALATGTMTRGLRLRQEPTRAYCPDCRGGRRKLAGRKCPRCRGEGTFVVGNTKR